MFRYSILISRMTDKGCLDLTITHTIFIMTFADQTSHTFLHVLSVPLSNARPASVGKNKSTDLYVRKIFEYKIVETPQPSFIIQIIQMIKYPG